MHAWQITCVKASQGFDWNQGTHDFLFLRLERPFLDGINANMFMCFAEIFLPSYADYHFDDLERRQDPVQDIILTEEEIKNMFPS